MESVIIFVAGFVVNRSVFAAWQDVLKLSVAGNLRRRRSHITVDRTGQDISPRRTHRDHGRGDDSES